jgi:hypothetical protein
VERASDADDLECDATSPVLAGAESAKCAIVAAERGVATASQHRLELAAPAPALPSRLDGGRAKRAVSRSERAHAPPRLRPLDRLPVLLI